MLLTTIEFAFLTGLTPNRIHALCRKGTIKAFKIGGKDWRIPSTEVEKYQIKIK